MSYEYKDYFKTLNINESRKIGADINEAFNARDELKEVYTKAEAFDEIKKANAEYQFSEDVGLEVRSIIRKYESEAE